VGQRLKYDKIFCWSIMHMVLRGVIQSGINNPKSGQYFLY